jgi:hypothetical protein
MDTVEEQPVDSISDDLRSSFEEFDNSNEDVSTEDVDSEVSSEAAEVSTEESPEVQKLLPPEHWSQEDKDTFSSAPRDVQEWALKRHREMEGDYTRKSQEIADFKKAWEPVAEFYSPYMDQLRQSGMTPYDHIQRLANADLMMNQDPINGIQQIAQMYGIDLNNLNQESDNPEYDSLRQELAQLRNSITHEQQVSAQRQQKTILEQIESFAGETGEDGLLRPYFDEVMEDLVTLAQADRAAGREPELQSLYDRAVWANPSTREKILAAQKDAEMKKAEEEAKAKAAQAKRASQSISGNPGTSVNTDLSLRDLIKSQM